MGKYCWPAAMCIHEREERELKNLVFSLSEASCSPQDLTGGVLWSRRRVAPISIASGEIGAFGQSRQKRKKEITL